MFITPPRPKRGGKVSIKSRESVGDDRAYDVEVRDGSLRVSTTVIGEGPTVMLLHGWGGSASDMLPLALAFARAEYRAVLFDMPGHGRSPRRESSLVQFLHVMRAVSGALGVPELIVGHSFGGAAAVFGITELAFPVRGAILVAPAPGPAYYVDRFVRTIGLPATRTAGMIRRVVERVGRSVESLDTIIAARSAAVPAVIFHDPADREVPFELAAKLAATWPSSRLIPSPSLGHRRILQDPQTIAAAVQFASSLFPTPASTGPSLSL